MMDNEIATVRKEYVVVLIYATDDSPDEQTRAYKVREERGDLAENKARNKLYDEYRADYYPGRYTVRHHIILELSTIQAAPYDDDDMAVLYVGDVGRRSLADATT
jgi:hypothetical protein